MTMTRWIAAALVALAVSATAHAQDTDMPGEGVTVKPAVATWLDAEVTEAIFRVLLQELGYEVESAVPLSNPIFYQAVTQREVDFWSSGSFPLHDAQLPDDFEDHASIVGTAVERGVVQGYLVSKEAAETYDITSLDDFKRPEVKEAFDADGDGKADLVACPPGWGCEVVISEHLDVYDLHEHVNAITAAYNASFADAVARHRSGEPVLFYTWTPNYTLRTLIPGEDVVWINVPETVPTEAQEGFEDAMEVEGLEGAVTDPIRLGFVVNDTRVAANDDFLEENPAAATLFELVEIPREDISDITTRAMEGEESDEELVAMAEEWVAANQEQVDAWMEQARNAAR